MQPTYLPWIGYFDLIDLVDTFVIYDDVQFAKQSWQSRNRVKTANGITLLVVPIKKSNLDTKIQDVKIDYKRPWTKKHIKTIELTYKKAPFFSPIFEFICPLLEKEYESLSDLNTTIIQSIALEIGINTKFILSSSLTKTTLTKDMRLVNIAGQLSEFRYVSTMGAATYIEATKPGGAFSDSEITLGYHNYHHPVYNQSFGKFEPFMSVIDLLMNEGFERSLEIIRKGRGIILESHELSQSTPK